MSLSANNDLSLRKLIESIKRGKCILLLGPQASFAPEDSNCVPLTTRLAQHLATSPGLADDKNLLDRDDIAHVAQLFQQKRDRLELEMAVEEFYAGYRDQTTELHRHLAALPFTLCINTAPDNFFSNALKAEGKTPSTGYYHFKRATPITSVQVTADRPYIYNLYGHCDDIESLVLTENELLEFLVNIIKASPELPPFIRSQFADDNINFLFVGFGFQSWHNRILLHTLKAYEHRNQSLAIEDQSFFDHPGHSQTVLFYSHHHKIKFERHSWTTFAGNLCNAYRPAAKTAMPQTQLPEDAPKVFICYATEDHEATEQLSQQLHAAGINIWQDRQNLRAGDNWDLQLIHIINTAVDYVLVAQSPSMLKRIEGYFHKEINTALDRQQKFGLGFAFILPVQLSDCDKLQQLAHLHSIRLDTPAGLKQLTAAITEDWQKRKNRVAA